MCPLPTITISCMFIIVIYSLTEYRHMSNVYIYISLYFICSTKCLYPLLVLCNSWVSFLPYLPTLEPAGSLPRLSRETEG